MQRVSCLVLALILISSSIQAQRQGNIWYFGYNAGVSFNSGTPVALTDGKLLQSEGCATIADGNGNLLFYTDGNKIYNRNHLVMPNGSGLLGQSISAQSAIIVPMPQSSTIYYVFTIGDWTNTGSSYGLNYSVIDMSLDGGLGDVTTKNVMLLSNSREQVTAIHHSNCQDVWVIAHEKGNTNNYQAFLLTAAGVNTTPVISSVGMTYPGGNRFGYLRASHNGKKICSTLGGGSVGVTTTQLLDFDNATGQISNAITLALYTDIPNAYASEFSADDSKLYVVAYNGSFIYQYDISLGAAAAITASRTDVSMGTSSTKACVQMGPDKKIYVSRSAEPYLGVINNPNNAGTASNYVNDGVDLLGRSAALGLPNFNALYFSYPNLGPDTVLCTGNVLPFDVSGLGATSYLWDDGSTSPANTITQPGWHWVEVSTSTGCRKRDSVEVKYLSLQVSLGNDTVLCGGNKVQFDASYTTAGSYLWQDNSTQATYEAATAGKYWVEVSKYGCKASDTVLVTLGTLPVASLGNDSMLCQNATMVLDVTNAANASYLWQNGSTQPAFSVSQPGQYWVDVLSYDGCHKKDTINISYSTLQVALGNDTTLCTPNSLLLDATPAAGDSYLWQDGSVSPGYTVSSPGRYWVDVKKNGCLKTDTVVVAYAMPPAVELGSDTTLCTNATLTLQATDPLASQYLWQDASSGSVFTVSTPGKYWVRVSNAGCVRSDTISVAYLDQPVLDLGNDKLLCNGKQVLLDASVNTPATWLWQDGSTGATYNVTQTGKYEVAVTTFCGVITDAIQVSFEKCNCEVSIPNAFTPDGNGRNDQFKALTESGCRFIEYRLTVFNRWGQKIFESTNPAIGWNGNTQSASSDVGGYPYIFSYRTAGSEITETRKGIVLLLR